MTFECLTKVVLCVRRVLYFIFVITRGDPIPYIVLLRIVEIIGFAKSDTPTSFLLEKEGGEDTF
jgi:hypothetical protein